MDQREQKISLILFLLLLSFALVTQGQSPRISTSRDCDPNDPFRCPNRSIPDPSKTPFPTPEPPGPCIPDPVFPNNSIVVTLYKGNVLSWFLSPRAESVRLILVRGVVGLLKAIDVRYSDGQIYGYADCNRIYRLNLNYGNATLVSELNVPFNGAYSVGFEFDPRNDSLARLVGNNNKNYLIEVDTGRLVTSGVIRYSPGDPERRNGPKVLDAGFSFTNPNNATLYVINGAGAGSLAILNPISGNLSTVGLLGAVPLGLRIGFDIFQFTDSLGFSSEFAVIVSVNRYWLVDLNTGKTARIWRRSLLRKVPYNAWGLTVVPPQNVATAFGQLTATYLDQLYTGVRFGNCTPCGSCPWDDRPVVLDDQPSLRRIEREVEQLQIEEAETEEIDDLQRDQKKPRSIGDWLIGGDSEDGEDEEDGEDGED